jgi:predicted permease
MSGPPRLALWLHERAVDPSEREAVVGDLLEEFDARVASDPVHARRWFWRQTLRSMPFHLRRRWDRSHLPQPRPLEGARPMNGLATDIRFALRLLRHDMLIASVAFVSLAAGLALNILLFTIANAVLIRPLAVRSPSELVVLALQRPSSLMHNFSYPDFDAIRTAAATPRALVAYSAEQATLSAEQVSSVVEGECVSGNFFGALGVPLVAGRGLADSDDRADAPPAVVISERVWRQWFNGAQPGDWVVYLNGRPFTVVGVASSAFVGMQIGRAADFWAPLAQSPLFEGGNYLTRADASWLTVIARVPGRQGVDVMRQEIDSIVRASFEARGRAYEPLVLLPGARGDSALPMMLQRRLLVLNAAGILVLLVACLNVANLQLARIEGRRSELAVRAALGARRSQLVRLLVIDAFLLAAGSGLAGLIAAAQLKDAAASLIALFGSPVALSVPIDARVAAVAVVVSVAAALLIAVISAWQAVRTSGRSGLHESRTVAGGRQRAQQALVVLQFALSMALLVGAALLARTVDNLRKTDLGFETKNVAVIEVAPEMARIEGQALLAYFDDTLRVLRAMPWIEEASISHVMPLDFGGSRTSVDVAGHTPRPDEESEFNFARVSPGYFNTVGVSVLRGRAFDDRDRGPRPRHIIVNETMARRFWPGGNAIGQLVRFDPDRPYEVEVVGIAADAHYRMVRENPQPSFYVPLAEWPARTGVIHVRLGQDPKNRVEELRRLVAGVNPAVPVTRASTLENQIERNIADERLAGTIGATLALATLVLAAAGLYAAMAFFVGRRTREIGVRMALGARAADVRRLVLGDAVVLVIVGILAGLALAVWTGRALRNLLYGVDAIDTASYGAAAAVLAAAALLATWIPARRAASVDPVVALRE